jgi:ABC-type glycerol-3-phosphate transport system substrate-binding protein
MRKWLLFFLLLAFSLAGCQASFPDPFHLKGNLLLWHSWDEVDASVLDEVLSQITEIMPETEIVSIYVPADEMRSRYIMATQQGVGPDLLLAPSEWVHEFVDAGVVRPITIDELGVNSYLPAALASVYYQDDYYGFPLSVFPVALYYNTQLTSNPPVTLSGLLDRVEEGESIAFVPRFQLAYWGIQPFGAGLFDASGRFTLAQSGFTGWLTWLVEAQNLAGVILNPDAPALESMFVEGRVTYYVAGPESLLGIKAIIGKDSVGIAPLPSGPNGPSGPLLPTETVFLGATSSSEQTASALHVAQFLTNPQQSTIFMHDMGRVPANDTVVVDPRVYPVLSGFAQQARTAVALPNTLFREEFYELGDRTYANVLSGVLTPEEAVCQFGLAVVDLQGYTEEDATLPENCSAPDEGDR